MAWKKGNVGFLKKLQKKVDGELVQWAVVGALRCFSDGTFPSVALFNLGESRQRGFLTKNCVSETSHPHFIVLP